MMILPDEDLVFLNKIKNEKDEDKIKELIDEYIDYKKKSGNRSCVEEILFG